MSTDTVRFALIGCGTIAPPLADGVQKSDGATIGACTDLVAENARDLAEEYGVKQWYTDHETMLREADPDVAIVATPSGTHSDIVVDCAEAGVHVLCQKPLDLIAERIDAMVRACADNDVKLGGLYNLRFEPGTQLTRQVLADELLGDVVLANGTVPVHRGADYYQSTGWRGTPDMDGSCLFNQGIHIIDRLAWFNDGIERVFADLDTVAHDIETADVAAVQVRYGNGARGTITVTTAAKHYPHYDRVDVHGTEGYLVSTADEVLSFDSTDHDTVPFENPYDRSGFGVQIQDMANAVREDRDPIVAGQEARHACDAVLAMHESARRDEPVHVGEVGEDYD